MKKNFSIIPLVFLALVFYAGSAAAEDKPKPLIKITLFESFEESPRWFAVGDSWKDGDTSKNAVQSTLNANDGDYSLECSFDMPAGKAATYYMENPEISDWTDVKSVLVDVFNPLSTPLKLALAVKTGSGWTWQETGIVIIAAGANNDVKFDLLTRQLKSDKTKWAFAADIQDPGAVHAVILKFFSDAPARGSAFIDNIRLVK